ncbi:DUF1254 domain-containing protein [Methylocystis bryophila]|uniref:Cell envelope protein n=1 Tax=Methylocystis bryophila TaxID=655015 RepID=A0A1W6MZF8_9HYPH|nr:DUF1254 domain-containing protein [Methylocystis bryophila]ARN82916.1 hypothetical protein B1812_19605 [Methylocystis bryophila]BDV39198.1 hypothetical protein DSM21852_24510 [Methylocystis bryophila]
MRVKWIQWLLVLAFAALGGCGDRKAQEEAEAAAREKAALEIGVDAVIYGLPLVIMDITKAKLTNVAKPQGFAAPVNQFVNARSFPDASFKDVVRPNVDTLYSAAFLDLSAEPIVLSAPDTHGRYYLMPILDAWTNIFASPGKRTTGTKAGHFAITGPGWQGTLPNGVTELKSPTNMAWIIGRTQTNGPADYPAVRAIQDGYKLTPLSAFGKRYVAPQGKVDPNVDMKTPPVEQLQNMSAEAFFDRLAMLLQSNPPPASEATILTQLKAIGITPGEKFELPKLDPAKARGLEKSVAAALEKLRAETRKIGAGDNGWRIPPMTLGNFGDNYALRAQVALIGLGANLPQDAVYPSAFVDADGKPFDGANRYVIHFDKSATPPVDAFWSITLYGEDGFFVANPINRFAISSWMPLKKNADGSVDVYVQRASPGKDKESNWLPAGEKAFNLTLRMYWPKEKPPSILDGSWKPPAVRQAP